MYSHEDNRRTRYPVSPARAWLTVAICTLAYVFAYIDRQILSLLVGPIKADLHVSDSQFGLLSGLAFALFYAVAGIPIAGWSDTRSRSRIIALGVFVWSLATVTCGLARSFVQLFLARVCVGAGEASISPASYSLIADLFPKARLGRALAVYSTGSFVGSGLGFLVGGWVVGAVQHVGMIDWPLLRQLAPWQLAFVMVGVPGILLALVLPWLVKEPRVASVEGAAAQPRLVDVLRFMAQARRVFISLFVGYSFAAMSLFSLMAWAPAYLMRSFALSASQAGYRFGLIVLIGCTAGVLTGGQLVDTLRQRGRRDAPFLAGIIGLAGVVLGCLPLLIVDHLNAALTSLAVSTFFATFALPASTTAMQLMSPPHMRARVSALFLFCNSIFGLALGAFLVGLLNDRVFASVAPSLTLVVAGAAVCAVGILAVGVSAFVRLLQTTERRS